MKIFYVAKTEEGGRARVTQDVVEHEEWVAVKRALAGDGLAVVHWS